MIRTYCKEALQNSLNLLQSFRDNEQHFVMLEKATQELRTAFQAGNKVLICGNGGSACDAMHFAQEFTGRYRKDRAALPAISLSDPSYLTCVGNDYGFESVFARGVEAYGKKGDIFIGLTTSGNSENVIRACIRAKELGLYTMSLLGQSGGKLKGQADLEWIIPGTTADRIQEVHMFILHLLVEQLERLMFPKNY